MLAEAAVFLLAGRMPRPEAQALVAAAVADVRAGGTSLAEALERRAPGGTPWTDLLDPARHTGDAEQIVDDLITAIGDTTDLGRKDPKSKWPDTVSDDRCRQRLVKIADPAEGQPSPRGVSGLSGEQSRSSAP